ncbi:MAG: hypothetical protein ACI4JZ_08905 [Oscillospiraceae bacterium]
MDKTGLAIEAARIFTEKDGVSAVSRTVGAVKITDVKICENAARRVSARSFAGFKAHEERCLTGEFYG